MRSLATATVFKEIRRRIASLSATDQGRWGRMSVDQMVCHLLASLEVASGTRPVAKVRLPLPPRVLKWIALRSPMPWPKNVQTVPELRVGTGAVCSPALAVHEEFVANQQTLLRALEAFVQGSAWCEQHPMFGAMSRADWMRWAYLHTDHHLRQFGR